MPRAKKTQEPVSGAPAPVHQSAQQPVTSMPQPQYATTQYATPAASAVPQSQRSQRKKGMNPFMVVIAIVIVLAVGYGLFMGGKAVIGSIFGADKKNEEIVQEIGRMVIVPEESPQIAKVTDVESVRKQSPFFADVEEGDVVVAYVQAKKIIIYRPSQGRIVNMSLISE